MIGRTNVSSIRPYARIFVNYPSGSTLTCTCTETSEVLSAEDTSGKWVFEIPYAGTWTSTSTDGSSTESVETEIDTELQISVVTILYNLELFVNGVPTASEVFEAMSGYTLITGHTYTGIDSAGSSAYFKTIDKIDLTKYSTLHVDGTVYNSGPSSANAKFLFGFSSTGTETGQYRNTLDSGAFYVQSCDRATYQFDDKTIDISTLTGEWYLEFVGWWGSGSYMHFNNIWLEV